jgi:hypothetical protein
MLLLLVVVVVRGSEGRGRCAHVGEYSCKERKA